MFGYIGRTIQGKGLGYLAEHYGWTIALYSILAVALVAILLLAFTVKLKPRG